MIEQKFPLRDEDIPRQWYNLAADLPTPLEPLRTPAGELVTPEMMAARYAWMRRVSAGSRPDTSTNFSAKTRAPASASSGGVATERPI